MAVQAKWGSLIFQATRGKSNLLEDMTSSAGYSFENDETAGSKPTTSRKGPELRKMSFKLHASSVLGIDPQTLNAELQRLSENAQADYFYLGGVKQGNHKWVLKNVGLGNATLNHQGWLLDGGFSLTFEEYIPDSSGSGASKADKAANKRSK